MQNDLPIFKSQLLKEYNRVDTRLKQVSNRQTGQPPVVHPLFIESAQERGRDALEAGEGEGDNSAFAWTCASSG